MAPSALSQPPPSKSSDGVSIVSIFCCTFNHECSVFCAGADDSESLWYLWPQVVFRYLITLRQLCPEHHFPASMEPNALGDAPQKS